MFATFDYRHKVISNIFDELFLFFCSVHRHLENIKDVHHFKNDHPLDPVSSIRFLEMKPSLRFCLSLFRQRCGTNTNQHNLHAFRGLLLRFFQEFWVLQPLLHLSKRCSTEMIKVLVMGSNTHRHMEIVEIIPSYCWKSFIFASV